MKKILLLILFLLTSPAFANHTFITAADIHFSPFGSCQSSPCPLITHLEKAPVTEWEYLLSLAENNFPEDHQETNSILLQSFLTELKKQSELEQSTFILLLGDYLGHHYRDKFFQYADHPSQMSYRDFVGKTFEFLTLQIKKTINDKSV